ncbi:MAG: chemotaxis protein CheW [Deltaproteobacteria bacterium]|nr:chemotaxis protein CheW [Deltaproteobacteria bacterium]
MDIFIFEAAGHYIGIEAKYIYRVADNVSIVPVPLMPSCYGGLIYYRGDLFDVIDMGRFMEKETSSLHDDPYIILLKWDAEKVGLIPDRIVGIKWVEDDGGAEVAFNERGDTAELMTPGGIWKKLAGLAYGT